jgi:ABC-type polysaccharide/polyol phosphate export permease
MNKILKNFEFNLFMLIIIFGWIFSKDSDKIYIFLFIGLIGIAFIINILSAIRNTLKKNDSSFK